LKFWQERLKPKCVSDLERCLPLVELALQELFANGKGFTGKTLNNYADALRGFLTWAIKQKYLTEHPLANLQPYDHEPKIKKRALTAEEATRLLNEGPQERRLLYELALSTGLRANEIRSLKVKHLDTTKGGLVLESAWTKNREAGFMWLPADLVRRLAETCQAKLPEARLLKISEHHAGRQLQRDLKNIGIEPCTPEGKVDFHALRNTAITLSIESGANLKEAQELARHSDPRLTMNIYAKARSSRMKELAESVSQRISRMA
jgi:integrase